MPTTGRRHPAVSRPSQAIPPHLNAPTPTANAMTMNSLSQLYPASSECVSNWSQKQPRLHRLRIAMRNLLKTTSRCRTIRGIVGSPFGNTPAASAALAPQSPLRGRRRGGRPLLRPDPRPFQMLGAAICCVLFRVNLPLALSPRSTPILHDRAALPRRVRDRRMVDRQRQCLHPASRAWRLADVELGGRPDRLDGRFGKPLALGLVAIAAALASTGYLVVRGLYRWHLIRACVDARFGAARHETLAHAADSEDRCTRTPHTAAAHPDAHIRGAGRARAAVDHRHLRLSLSSARARPISRTPST